MRAVRDCGAGTVGKPDKDAWSEVFNMSPRILIPIALIVLAALEVHQQLHAGLLTQPWTGP
jgi:hypothetical protein